MRFGFFAAALASMFFCQTLSHADVRTDVSPGSDSGGTLDNRMPRQHSPRPPAAHAGLVVPDTGFFEYVVDCLPKNVLGGSFLDLFVTLGRELAERGHIRHKSQQLIFEDIKAIVNVPEAFPDMVTPHPMPSGLPISLTESLTAPVALWLSEDRNALRKRL